MKIKIFAPVDCEVKSITKCSDPIFAKKMMGDGILIIPKNNSFYSPFEKAEVSLVFDTLHAYGFKINDFTFFLHCGLETVALNGKPFTSKVKVNDELTLKQNIFDVDLKLLKNEKLSNETPLVIENNDNFDFKLKDFKEGNYKRGELICIVDTKNKQQEKPLEEFFNSTSKYKHAYDEINKLVGSQQNYLDVYNCMTRLRFKIIDKNLVNVNGLTKIDLVKGVVWNDHELQVVIGQDVYKLKNEFVNQNNLQKHVNAKINEKRTPPFKRFLSMFGSIMIQIIPIFIGTGIVQAIIGVCTWVGIMPAFSVTIESIDQLLEVKGSEVFWLILFVIGKSSSLFMGIAVAYAASQYFDLRRMIGVILGLTICSPILFLAGGTLGIGGEWELFNLGKLHSSDSGLQIVFDKITSIVITPGNMKVFVVIMSVYLAKRLDDWIGKWINPLFELTVRSFLVFLITGLVTFFVFMPVWNFAEGILSLVMFYVAKAPLGIGVGIYTALWQVAVVFGLHMALGIVSMIQGLVSSTTGMGGYGIFGLGGSISVYSQLGALIGLILITRNKLLKKDAIALIPIGLLGITEPIIYGMNLPKKRPFLAGIISAFIAGCFTGIFGVTQRIGTGIGVFEIIGYFQYTILDPTGEIGMNNGELSQVANGLLYIASCLVALSTGILLGMLLYKERVTENKQVNILNRNLIKLISLKNNLNKEQFETLKSEVTENKKVFDKSEIQVLKNKEKEILSILQLQSKIEKLESKEQKRQSKIMKKGKQLLKENKIQEAESLKKTFFNDSIKLNINTLKDQKSKMQNELTFKDLDFIIKEKFTYFENLILKINYLDEVEKNKIVKNYLEALSSLKIDYEYQQPADKEVIFNFKEALSKDERKKYNV